MNRLTKILMAAGMFLALTGCLVPENFTLKVEFKEDGSYRYAYSGNIVNGMAAQAAKRGQLKANDQDSLRKEGESWRKDPAIKSVDYKGDGRYKITVDGNKMAGQPMTLFDGFHVRHGKDGTIMISAPSIKDGDLKKLKEVGIDLSGKLEVHLPKNVEIVSSNATSTPSLLNGAYGWKIGSGAGPGPMLKFRFKK